MLGEEEKREVLGFCLQDQASMQIHANFPQICSRDPAIPIVVLQISYNQYKNGKFI